MHFAKCEMAELIWYALVEGWIISWCFSSSSDDVETRGKQTYVSYNSGVSFRSFGNSGVLIRDIYDGKYSLTIPGFRFTFH